MSVVLCASVDELIGCFITISPSRSCDALSKILGNYRCMLSEVVSVIKGMMVLHIV